jgi:hypothetical protein
MEPKILNNPLNGHVFQSDRGGLYCSHDFQILLGNNVKYRLVWAENVIARDNAVVAESFFCRLKEDQVLGDMHLIWSAAKQEIVNYLEMY